MIKQFLFFAAAAIALVACDTEDEAFAFEERGYKGTMTVKSLDSDKEYTYTDKNFDLAQGSDQKIALWMYDTQFVPMMPKMTMIVPGLTTESTDGRFILSGDKIIPYYRDGNDMLPMDESRLITDFSAALDKKTGSLEVTFDCMGFRVDYRGAEIKK